MINNLNGSKNIYTIDRTMLPKRNFLPYEEVQFSPNDKKHFIIANKEANKAELQEVAKLLSEKMPVASFWGLEGDWCDECNDWF